jgi:hypothetical protein
MMKKEGSDPDRDPLVRGMDPRIRIRIHTKMSWIRNNATHTSYFFIPFTLFVSSYQNFLKEVWYYGTISCLPDSIAYQ